VEWGKSTTGNINRTEEENQDGEIYKSIEEAVIWGYPPDRYGIKL
jgi:hypothetical protein